MPSFSRLIDALADWLLYPSITVKLANDDETQALQQENERLKTELAQMKSSYVDACNLQLRYADVLREHGLPLK